MPRKDIYHDIVKNALIKDGWAITHDPLTLSFGGRDTYVDLGAERLIGAVKGKEKIAVEVKSFIGVSIIDDLEKAIGQYILYQKILSRIEPERVLYIAVSQGTFTGIFSEPLGNLFLLDKDVKLIVFDREAEVILRWIL